LERSVHRYKVSDIVIKEDLKCSPDVYAAEPIGVLKLPEEEHLTNLRFDAVDIILDKRRIGISDVVLNSACADGRSNPTFDRGIALNYDLPSSRFGTQIDSSGTPLALMYGDSDTEILGRSSTAIVKKYFDRQPLTHTRRNNFRKNSVGATKTNFSTQTALRNVSLPTDRVQLDSVCCTDKREHDTDPKRWRIPVIPVDMLLFIVGNFLANYGAKFTEDRRKVGRRWHEQWRLRLGGLTLSLGLLVMGSIVPFVLCRAVRDA
jgi:hypothetical protein